MCTSFRLIYFGLCFLMAGFFVGCSKKETPNEEVLYLKEQIVKAQQDLENLDNRIKDVDKGDDGLKDKLMLDRELLSSRMARMVVRWQVVQPKVSVPSQAKEGEGGEGGGEKKPYSEEQKAALKGMKAKVGKHH